MIEDPLKFSRSERRVILLFMFSIALLSFIPVPYSGYMPDWNRVDSLLCKNLHAGEVEESFNRIPCLKKEIQEVTIEDWLNLGAPTWLAERIEKYRLKGGNIEYIEDLARIYGIDTTWLKKIDSCIIWKATITNVRNPSKRSYKPIPLKVYINSADTSDWMKLKGIGPVLSKRIVKFRDKLGGFYSIEQVNETYGISDSLFATLRPFLIAEDLPKHILINTADYNTLALHPYISKRDANIIINYRVSHGPFNEGADIYNIIALDSNKTRKLIPYLSFD